MPYTLTQWFQELRPLILLALFIIAGLIFCIKVGIPRAKRWEEERIRLKGEAAFPQKKQKSKL